MSPNLLLIIAALQNAPAAQPDTIVNLVIEPASPVLVPGDSIQLRAEALDSKGVRIEDVRIRFSQAGGQFEGTVDADGLVKAGSVGTLAVTVLASRRGQRPVLGRVAVRIVPGPASVVEIPRFVEKIVVGQRVRLSARSFSALGDERDDVFNWTTSNPEDAEVDGSGIVTGISAGRVRVAARTGNAEGSIEIEVVPNTIEKLVIEPAAARARQGDVIDFAVRALDGRDREIEGLTPSWSFSPGQGLIGQDGRFVGYEAGEYTVTASFGTMAVEVPVKLTHRDVRRAPQVLGRVPLGLKAEEVWLHPDEDIAYLGTGSGGDRLYTIDVSDPENPAIVDSLVVDTRRVNDVMTTPDGEYLVFTREGASSRRNGIVIASLADPLHPEIISEFTEGVTAGVHSAFVYRQDEFGTHVYLTNDGTGAFHIIDITDPYNPVEAAQWRTERPDAGRSLHDVDVQNGLAYLSYWNDGLVVLDVGNGVRGGSPSDPQFVTQFKYDHDELYREVEAIGGPGYIRGTHTAWRHNDYVFIADEVFPATTIEGAKDASARRAWGRLQVIDVSDLDNPKSVAWYEPEFGGVHNVWVAGDTLYMGAYQGGFRAFDITGELKGDLRAQKREIVHLNTGDKDGWQPNHTRTWGAVVRDGIAYVNDTNNGLWIVKIKPREQELVP